MSGVAIVGMHRSGTSLVARALAVLGLHLGEEAELVPPNPANPDGYWEHAGFQRLNDAVLTELGGGWERPPELPSRWRDEPRLVPLEREARALLRSLRRATPWGWKDPRTSLTLPLWLLLEPRLRAVVCVRNPLETALSLHRRGMFSFSTSFALWHEYNRRVVAALPPARRLVIDYDALLADPASQLERLATFAGLDRDRLADAAALVDSQRRHHAANLGDLLESGAAPEVVELYLALRREAGAEAPEPGAAALEQPPRRLVDPDGAALQLLRRRVAQLERDAAYLRGRLEAAEERAAESEARELALLRGRAAGEDPILDVLEDVQAQLYELEAQGGDRADADYRRIVRRIRSTVRETVPPDASVLVVSKGDAALLRLYGRQAAHFPAGDDGLPAGWYPTCSLSAVAHLEARRAHGADHLLFPAPSLWWLDHYDGLRRHLEHSYRLLVRDEACALYELRKPPRRELEAPEILGVIEEARARLGREPSVLDWNTGLDLARALPAQHAFSPPRNGARLPYLDGTVDIVVLGPSGRRASAEAERVAAAAVVALRNGKAPRVGWKVAASPTAASVSIVIPCHDGLGHTRACLTALGETLPRGLEVEIVVVDDASSDGTEAWLAAAAGSDPRLRILRNDANLGFLDSANRGAQAAGGDVLVFLNNDTVPLAGWLPPLLELLAARADAGAVGGRLLYPDGRLQEAGAIVFADGSAAKIGYGHADPESGEYTYVREVDYVSGCLLATPRALFAELGGFDARYRPGFYEDTDYCFRLREAGRAVYYQPASTVVHVEGATAGVDPAHGPKRFQARNQETFARRWRRTLRDRPARPPVLDHETLHALLTAGG